MDNKKKIKWILCVLLAVPAIYILVQIGIVLHSPYTTQTAIQYTMSDSMVLDGVVCFEQQPVPGSGEIGYLVSSGERVPAGAQVAEMYTDSVQAQSRAQLKKLDHQMELLQHAQNASGTDIGVLLGKSQAAVYDLLDGLDRKNYAGLQDSQDEYLLAANKLQIITGKEKNFAPLLDAMTAAREQLVAAVGSPQAVTVPEGGYFVAMPQAKFLSVSEEQVSSAAPADYRELLNQQLEVPGENVAGKVVSSYRWRFYGTCTLEQSENFRAGQKVEISFPEKAETPRPAKVIEVQADKNSGLAKVVVESDYVGGDILALGQQPAKIDFSTYKGLRLNVEALHIVDGVKGVYVKHGNLAKFRKITILYQDEDYMLVPLDGAVGTDSEVRLFDEVIVQGSDLKDKKLLQ